MRVVSAPPTPVIFSAPTTSATGTRPDSTASQAAYSAAAPEAQAFSTRVAGAQRSASSACSTSDEAKISGTKPPLSWPSQMPPTSPAPMPAWAKGLTGDAADQRLQVLAIEPPETRMRPTHHARAHCVLLCCAGPGM